jgi:toxin secretion/phage lysis holin
MMYYLLTIKEHTIEIATSIWSWGSLKMAAAIPIGAFAYLIGEQYSSATTTLLVLVAFDFITAVIAKHQLGEEIESRKALKTVSKVIIYGMFISAAHLTEVIVPANTFMEETALSFLALTELISILENIGKMGYTVPQKLLNQLKEMRTQK